MKNFVFFCSIVVLATVTANAQSGGSKCVVDLPAYDQTGKKLDFSVKRVSLQGKQNLDLLIERPAYISASAGHIVLHDPAVMGRVLVITLADNHGHHVTQDVLISQCPQRTSVRYGIAEAYGDLAFETIKGRLSGCRLAGDWWVRAMPMFGPGGAPAHPEGYIAADGNFTITGHMGGERQILVFGKSDLPVMAIGVNHTEGRVTNAGNIDLTGHCPAEK